MLLFLLFFMFQFHIFAKWHPLLFWIEWVVLAWGVIIRGGPVGAVIRREPDIHALAEIKI